AAPRSPDRWRDRQPAITRAAPTPQSREKAVKKLGLLVGVWLVLLLVALPFDGPFLFLTGWLTYPFEVLPKVRLYWPSIILGGAALVLFTAGVHWLGTLSYGRYSFVRGHSSGWKLRWSLAIVVFMFILFAAGISLVGVTHQAAWLMTSDEPLL